MNNEDKRFKQINRIATPISVDTVKTDTTNNSEKTIEQAKIVEEAIPPKKEVIKVKKERKKIKKETVVKSLIVIFTIGIILSSAYLLIPASRENKTIKYNDFTSTTTEIRLENDFFESINLSDTTYLSENIDYNVDEFNIKIVNKAMIINNKEIIKKDYFYSNVSRIDDLLIFSGKDENSRTTELLAIDKSGEIVLNYYHVGDINGMVIADEANSIVYNSAAITLITKNVLNDTIVPNNQINKSNQVSICNEDELFRNSIETNLPVVVYYLLSYKGNHEFNDLEIIYQESLDEYKQKHNYCN